MYYKGTKEQCDIYNDFVSQEIFLTNGDKWATVQETNDGYWVIFKHPSFNSEVLEATEDPDFKIN